jgi:hypothetical protein
MSVQRQATFGVKAVRASLREAVPVSGCRPLVSVFGMSPNDISQKSF